MSSRQSSELGRRGLKFRLSNQWLVSSLIQDSAYELDAMG